jgi:hypothetical protein
MPSTPRQKFAHVAKWTQNLRLPGNRGMNTLMKNSKKKVLPFPKPPEEPAASTIVVQIGKERFAIHWEIEELPPAAPLLLWKRAAKGPRRRS